MKKNHILPLAGILMVGWMVLQGFRPTLEKDEVSRNAAVNNPPYNDVIYSLELSPDDLKKIFSKKLKRRMIRLEFEKQGGGYILKARGANKKGNPSLQTPINLTVVTGAHTIPYIEAQDKNTFQNIKRGQIKNVLGLTLNQDAIIDEDDFRSIYLVPCRKNNRVEYYITLNRPGAVFDCNVLEPAAGGNWSNPSPPGFTCDDCPCTGCTNCCDNPLNY